MQKTLKAKLEAIPNDKTNLYTHLTDVLRTILIEKPADPYTLFEEYSLRLKSQDRKQSPQDHTGAAVPKELLQSVQRTRQLINKPNVGTEEQPAEPGPTGYLPNLLEESRWFELHGISLGEEQTYKIFKSLERFSILKQIKQLRFWGKILGTQKDYYIAEGVSEGGEEAGQLPPDVEAKGVGVNKLTYWVCTDLMKEWAELPLITPDQMRVSRKIKYLFTGNLETPIYTNPSFFGKQKHLLKCQIVRMTNSCTLVPRTMYNVNAEDKKEIDPQEEWKWPAFQTLSSLENWVHHPLSILKNGRQSHLKPVIPQGVEVDQEKLMKEIESKDPFEERLKPISKDKYLNVPAWKISVAGDSNDYRAPGKQGDKINFGVVALRSNIWRGFTTVYHNKQTSSIYIGYGIKTSGGSFYPCDPQEILHESKDSSEQPEPNYPPEEPKKPEEPAAGEAQNNDAQS